MKHKNSGRAGMLCESAGGKKKAGEPQVLTHGKKMKLGYSCFKIMNHTNETTDVRKACLFLKKINTRRTWWYLHRLFF